MGSYKKRALFFFCKAKDEKLGGLTFILHNRTRSINWQSNRSGPTTSIFIWDEPETNRSLIHNGKVQHFSFVRFSHFFPQHPADASVFLHVQLEGLSFWRQTSRKGVNYAWKHSTIYLNTFVLQLVLPIRLICFTVKNEHHRRCRSRWSVGDVFFVSFLHRSAFTTAARLDYL